MKRRIWHPFFPKSGADYGTDFGGVDGSGPNHGPVTGFGSGTANASHPDPEAWANAYLRDKGSTQEFYGDPSATGSSGTMSSSQAGASTERADYGHDYMGVPGSGPEYGAVDGFSEGNASQAEVNPEAWAQAYVHENGGPTPEYIDLDAGIAQAAETQVSRPVSMHDSSGEILETSNIGADVVGSVQDIYFAFDSWSISAEGAKYLEEDAKWLHANPAKALTIEGHCDQRGTQDYNLILGKKTRRSRTRILSEFRCATVSTQNCVVWEGAAFLHQE